MIQLEQVMDSCNQDLQNSPHFSLTQFRKSLIKYLSQEQMFCLVASAPFGIKQITCLR